MNLIDLYIQEVAKRLPEKNREDITLELRSIIDDMLPEDYNEKDVKSVLEKLGSPVSLANGYLDRPMHLIGPRYFDVYTTLLKMIIPIAAVIALISMIAENFIGYSGDQAVLNVIFQLIGKGIGEIFEVGLHVFFWLTLVFVILERTDTDKGIEPLTTSLKKWTPDDLKNISYIPKKKAISKFEVFGGLMWTAVWATLYFYANHLVGVYNGTANGLKFVSPTFNQDVLLQYWPIVVIMIVFEICISLYKLVQGQWTQRLAIGNAILQVAGTIVFIVIVVNPHVFNAGFITYLANAFTISLEGFKTWLVGGGIVIYTLSAAINIFDGFRKVSIRM
ncbi:HAAS signaling domain-containing protein [Bacillus cereus group sp. MYBK181-1]|uniref:HAAS signaling domain-containing protein n=1 Tax=unclassified Bacillus cereus group TaxID=2750818 RepID=UPI003F79AA43